MPAINAEGYKNSKSVCQRENVGPGCRSTIQGEYYMALKLLEKIGNNPGSRFYCPYDF